MIRDIDYILEYIRHYVIDTSQHDSEPMLNWKDLEKLLDYIKELNDKYYRQQEILDKIKEKVSQYEFISGYYDDNYDGEDTTYSHDTLKEELLKLLEKIE